MSIIERRGVAYAKRWARLRVPWLNLADLSGLLAALWLLSIQEPAVSPLMIVLLTTSSVLVWLLGKQMRAGPTAMVERGYRLLLVPAAATAAAIGLSAFLEGRLSVASLSIFVVTWTGWMLLARFAIRRFGPSPRILYVGAGADLETLRAHTRHHVTHAAMPPARLKAWDVVVVDPTEEMPDDWKQWILHANLAGLKVLPAPLAIETLSGRLELAQLDTRWTRALFQDQEPTAFWKRAFDVTAVILLSPILLVLSSVVALVVWLNGGRPILFWQERVGLGGKPFKMVKFRTMRPDAESKGAAFAAQGDPRVTRVGAFLRKFRLDELPQFWNVLRGEMSIVGPRPEQVIFSQQFEEDIPLYELRHRARPGITGWAQVMNGYTAGEAETREKLCYDLYYIKNFSPLLDLLVLIKTVRIILTGFGAR